MFGEINFSALIVEEPKIRSWDDYLARIASLQGNNMGLAATLNFQRHFSLALLQENFEATKKQIEEQEDGALAFNFGQVYQLYLKSFADDSEKEPIIALSDFDVFADEQMIPQSQIIGVGAYVAQALFVDLLLGFSKSHADKFGLINKSFLASETDTTKSVLVKHVESLISSNLFSAKDFVENSNAVDKLTDNLIKLSNTNFDNAVIYEVTEKQNLKFLSQLTGE